MKTGQRKHFSNVVIVVAIALALVWTFSPTLKTRAQSTHTPWQNLTQSQLTAVWWQWAYSIPVSSSPLFDDAGINAYSNQPYSNLLFLCGTSTIQEQQNGDLVAEVTRSISVEQGTALFFPLINGQTDNICGSPHLGGNCFGSQFPNVLGASKLEATAIAQMEPVEDLYASLTPADSSFTAIGPAVELSYTQLLSPPFSYKLPKTDNIYQNSDIDVSGTVAPAVADGYFSFVPGTLQQGSYYILQFGGKVKISSSTYFIEKITYHITVTPPSAN